MCIRDRVKGIANENATVIIGCIKEEDNLGELRVTLIATGFENTKVEGEENIDISDDTSPPAPNAVVGNVNPIPSSPGYNNATTSEGTIEKTSVDNIDIPAFLRQQAD